MKIWMFNYVDCTVMEKTTETALLVLWSSFHGYTYEGLSNNAISQTEHKQKHTID